MNGFTKIVTNGTRNGASTMTWHAEYYDEHRFSFAEDEYSDEHRFSFAEDEYSELSHKTEPKTSIFKIIDTISLVICALALIYLVAHVIMDAI